MSLMNGARIAVSAQALGIAEAAYALAKEYAETRIQFDKPIIEIPAVYKLLAEMRLNIEAGRLLLYETGKTVDKLKATTKNPDADRTETKYFERLAALLTPFSKFFNAEMANRTAYNGIQVMGGNGYMKDYNMERYYRDARITNIYEGTSQLQVVAAIGGILSGVLEKEFTKFAEKTFSDNIKDLTNKVKTIITDFNKTVGFIREQKDHAFVEYISDNAVKMGVDIFIATLFIDAAQKNERKVKLAKAWIDQTDINVKLNAKIILSGNRDFVDNHKDIII